MTDLAIRASALTRAFGPLTAVDALDLSITKGELFGIVGPDGAGKTTVMRLLAAIMAPTSGEAWVAGHSVLTESAKLREKTGYMSQRFGLYEDLTVMENISFYADLYEVPRKERPAVMEQLLGFSNLSPFKDLLAGRLSGGMKQKLGLACALVHTPVVLLLDEPTNGVDPVSRRDFWKILYSLLKRGTTIVITTSYLDEAERCTRIALIHEGRVLTEGPPDSIRRADSLAMVELWPDDPRRAASVLTGSGRVQDVHPYGGKLHVTLKEAAAVDIEQLMRENRIEIKGLRSIIPSLEDVFIRKVGGR